MHSRVSPQGPVHFKEDVLPVKPSRFTRVILSAAKDLSGRREILRGAQDDKASGMTKREGLVFEMD